MNIRIVLFIAALLPLHAFADKGDFVIKVADSVHVIQPSCIESVSYNAKSEFNSESVHFSLTSECGKLMSQITRQNVGGVARFIYKGNLISEVRIFSAISSDFMVSSKEIPRVVLMQMLNDYGAASE